VPDSERWLSHSQVSGELDEAIHWAEVNAPRETVLETLHADGDSL